MKIPRQQRKAISPIVATVLIIAATLIAAAAILGYVFGVFGGASNTANVSVTAAILPGVGSRNGATFAVACGAGSNATAQLTLSNLGSASTTGTSVYLIYGGNTYSASPAVACNLNSGTTGTVISFTALPITGRTHGGSYNGYVVLGNGGQAQFTGAFS